MVHPQYWCLDSLYHKIKPRFGLSDLDRKMYAPPFSLAGRTVLDVGAYIGDSALFFKQQGASNIICVEPFYFEILSANIAKYGIPTNIIPEKFKLDHLKNPHDFMKMDIEGYEEILLEVDPSKLKPSVLEVHGQQLIDKFEANGWTLMYREEMKGCVAFANNYALVIK